MVALMVPNLEPTVSTSMPAICTSAVVAISATNAPGIRRFTRGHSMMMSNERSATPSAEVLTVPMFLPYAATFSKKFAGTAPMLRPRKSLTWLEKMMTAIPLVNPVTRGLGTNLITEPSRASPIASSITPASRVAAVSPSSPYFWTMP